MNTRRTQPYRKGPDRHPSEVLDAMLKGRGPMPNPMDLQRRQARLNKILQGWFRGR